MSEQNIPSNKVYVLKMVAGDIIVGRVDKEDVNFLYVTKPHVVARDNNGQTILLPYIQVFKKDILPFNRGCIEVCEEAVPQLSGVYLKMTTGMDIPPTPSLLLE